MVRVQTRHIYRSNRRGLTLGEMLVVLAVVGILATMFMLSSQSALIKTRHSVVLNDEKVLAQGLDEFVAEYSRVPTDSEGLDALIRPNSMISKIPLDPFVGGSHGNTKLSYFNNISPSIQAIIVSAGPDGYVNIESILKQKEQTIPRDERDSTFLMTQDEALRFINAHQYDPTNGSSSSGDIIRIYRYQ